MSPGLSGKRRAHRRWEPIRPEQRQSGLSISLPHSEIVWLACGMSPLRKQ
jgi:hypothetical protein